MEKSSDTDMNPKDPKGVGESTTRRGEDVAEEDGREFTEKGTKGANRPFGEQKNPHGVDPPESPDN